MTGSTGGIGRATAGLLADEGASVITCGRGEAPGVGEAKHVKADLIQPGEPARVIAESGDLDVLVNNVGYAEQRDFLAVTDEQWNEVWELNVMSYVRAIRAAVPEMKQRGRGVIVNVSSTAGKRPSTGMPDYTVSKAAVLSLSRLVADLYAGDGIRCNAIAPGTIDTPYFDEILKKSTDPGAMRKALVARQLLGRLGTPEEIAAGILFLASDESRFATGTILTLDGGMTAQ